MEASCEGIVWKTLSQVAFLRVRFDAESEGKGDAPHLEDTLQFDTTRSLENHARDAIGSFIWVNFKLFNHDVTAMASRGNHGKMTLCRATELF